MSLFSFIPLVRGEPTGQTVSDYMENLHTLKALLDGGLDITNIVDAGLDTSLKNDVFGAWAFPAVTIPLAKLQDDAITDDNCAGLALADLVDGTLEDSKMRYRAFRVAAAGVGNLMADSGLVVFGALEMTWIHGLSSRVLAVQLLVQVGGAWRPAFSSRVGWKYNDDDLTYNSILIHKFEAADAANYRAIAWRIGQ